MSENKDYNLGFKFGLLCKHGKFCSGYPIVIDDPVEDKEAFVRGMMAAGCYRQVSFHV